MIDIVSGQVASLSKGSMVVMVGGVGLRVNVPKTVFDSITGAGQNVVLYTHLQVREDGLTLFGFSSEEERALFEILISVNGVGPKIGLAILSTLSVDHLRSAVGRDEPEVLTRVPGIGKKTAEKIVFELKNKIGIGGMPAVVAINELDTDVINALTYQFGLSLVEAQSALQAIPRDAPADLGTRIALALQSLSN